MNETSVTQSHNGMLYNNDNYVYYNQHKQGHRSNAEQKPDT